MPEAEKDVTLPKTSRVKAGANTTQLLMRVQHCQSPDTPAQPALTGSWEAVIHLLTQLSPILEQGFSHVASVSNFSWPSAIKFLPSLPENYSVGSTADGVFTFLDLKQFATDSECSQRKWTSSLEIGHLTDTTINWAIAKMASVTGQGPIWSLGKNTAVLSSWALHTVLTNSRGRKKIIQKIKEHFSEAAQVLIPANLNNVHWYLIRLRLQEGVWSVLDSSPEICKRERKTQVMAVKESLLPLIPVTHEESDALIFEKVSSNSSGVDCAIHVILTILQISRDGSIRLSKEVVANARKWILWLILWDLWKAQQLVTPPPAAVVTESPSLAAHVSDRCTQVKSKSLVHPQKHRGQPQRNIQRGRSSVSQRPGTGQGKVISRDKSGNYLVQLRDGLLCSISYANMKGYLLELAASVYTSQDHPPHRLVGMDENGNYRLALGPQSFGSVTPVDMRAHLNR